MTYQPDTLTEARFDAITNSKLLEIANRADARGQIALQQISVLRNEANSRFALITSLENLERQVAELRSLYQEVFNMAARAVSDIADAADRDGAE